MTFLKKPCGFLLLLFGENIKCGNGLVFVSFRSVAITAKHLAVVCNSCSAFAPRLNVVGFHFFEFKVFATMRANAFLAFVCLTLLLFIEDAE